MPCWDPRKPDGGWSEHVVNSFNPDQPRDDHGRFAGEGDAVSLHPSPRFEIMMDLR